MPVFPRHLVHNNFNGADNQFNVDSMGCYPQSDDGIFWQTDVFIQSISSLLLSWLSPDPFGQCSGASNPVLLNQPNGIPRMHNEMSLKPTTCHLYLVRCFLKYFYNAAFGTPYSAANCPQFTTPNQQILWNRIISYRRFLENFICGTPPQPSDSKNAPMHWNIMSRLRQLTYFCFQHWPLDLSFDVVLETWLTSIQPWRYAQTPQPRGSSPPDLTVLMETSEPRGSRLNSNTWSSFAVQQHDLFVAPLLFFLRRAMRMDLRVTRNAHMVYRVAKIISHPTVKMVMSAAEETLIQQTDGNIRTGYTSSDADQFPSIVQSGLWSPVVIEAVDCLLTLLTSTLSEIRRRRNQVNGNGSVAQSGAWQRFFRDVTQFFVGSEEDEEKRNVLLCEQYLSDSIDMMCQFFKIPDDQPRESPPLGPTLGSPSFSPLQLDDSFESPLLPASRSRGKATVQYTPSIRHAHFPPTQPSSPMTGEPVLRLRSADRQSRPISDNQEQLTPLSRFQILMGEKRPDIRFSGDPEYLPAYAFECSALVEIFRALADFINWKMRPRFLSWCSRPDSAGWIARHLLLPSDSVKSRDSSINPRISLRWLAGFPTIFGILLFFLFSFPFLGTRSPLLVALLGCLVYVCYQSLRLILIFVRETIGACKS